VQKHREGVGSIGQGLWPPHCGVASLLVMRFNPGNAHVRGLSRHDELVGSGELDGDQTTQKTRVLPRFGPRDG
jgi:hypothetical protein